MTEPSSPAWATALRRRLSCVAAFLLPLGFLGALAIPLMVVVLAADLAWGRAVRSAWRTGPWWFGVPLAALTLLSTALGPNAQAGLPSAVGMGLLYVVGFAAAYTVGRSERPTRLILAFVLGDGVLALSVIADAILGWHDVPAGLFWKASLQNWSASLLALGFPVSVWMAFTTSMRVRWVAAAAALAMAAGIFAGLSWVGAVGLLVGLIYLAFNRIRCGVALGCAVTALLLIGGIGLSNWVVRHGGVAIGGYSLSLLGEIIFARLRIMAEGLAVAALHPWLGWGWGAVHRALLQHPVGTFYMDDLSLRHFHNLYVQVLFEGGVFGLAAFALFVGRVYGSVGGRLGPGVRASLSAFLATQFWDYSWPQTTIVLSVLVIAAADMRRSA